MSLKNKRILITAGPTWVAIDSVRVISNTATGETGMLLAQALGKAGASVTLVMGPGGLAAAGIAKARVVRFTFFDELKRILEKELAGRAAYDAVIHSAAVSDYRPVVKTRGKIKSDLTRRSLILERTPKLIELIRKKAPRAMLAGFKFEPEASPKTLIAQARELGKNSGAELVVANTVSGGAYRAFIVTPQGLVPESRSKKEMVELLIMYLDAYFADKKDTCRGACSCGKC